MNKTNNIIYYVIKAYVQSVMRQLHINYRKSTKKKKKSRPLFYIKVLDSLDLISLN
jgi:hypothetical protein